MRGIVVLTKTKVLNVVPKSSEDGKINWTEVVTMQDADVNSINCLSSVADRLEVDQYYDLYIQISEVQKASKSGQVFTTSKFKVVDAVERE